MYKKIYVEITNNCNLKCDFCIKNERKIQYMKLDDFKKILNKIEVHTKYLYFHILGEPLMHPEINDFIDYAKDKFQINITTNGYLIKKIENNKNIRQINISLHSFNEKYNISLEDYMNNIFEIVDKLKDKTYISFRLWVNNPNNSKMLELIDKKYKKDNILEKNIYISYLKEFIWPDMNIDYYSEVGECYGLIDHIGILVDGTVVPCCLDSKGIINLGNILKEDLDEIVSKTRCKNMIEKFKNKEKVEELCKKCKFL